MADCVNLEPSGIKPCFDYLGKLSREKQEKIVDGIANLEVTLLKKTESHTIAEIKGLDVSFSNALRRILLSEVPTLAVETVQIYQNTGVIQDELLAHRLGLIPFNVNPDAFTFKNCDEINDKNSVCFKLKVKYEHTEMRTNYKPVYSGDLKWIPLSSNQEETFRNNVPAPVYDDILITKLAPGQEIDLNVYLEKGIGKVHSKWSPVSTAVYKFKPVIKVTGPMTMADKRKLVETCPMNVFALKNDEVAVENVLNCTSCRKCLEVFPNNVKISKLFNRERWLDPELHTPSGRLRMPEPLSPLKSEETNNFQKAVDVLKSKCLKVKTKLYDTV